jgi:hypothetical protein
MIKNLFFALGYIGVLIIILKLNSARWAAFRRRRSDRLSARLGQDPHDTVALMQQLEALWATDPGQAKRILEAHYVAERERKSGKGAASGKKAASEAAARRAEK